MKEYRFILRKFQDATITQSCSGDETVEEILKKIEGMTEEELDFSEPEYQLVAISKTDSKVSKLLWLLK